MPTTITSGTRHTLTLRKGQTVTITPASGSTARVSRLPTSSGGALTVLGTVSSATTYSNGSPDVAGYQVECLTGTCSVSDVSTVESVIDPANVQITGGSIGGVSVGAATPITALRLASNLAMRQGISDASGTPGNVTQNSTGRGRAAFAAGAQTVTVTNNLVAATSSVFVQLGGSDATLTSVRVTPGAGSFTVTGNAAATGATPFDYHVIAN